MTDQQQAAIHVTINGRPVESPPGVTVADYLAERGLHQKLVVVELNGVILSRSAFADTPLSDGDVVEIVHFVGGG